MKPTTKKYLFAGIAILIMAIVPVLIALPFQISYQNKDIIEVALVVSGLFYLLGMNLRYSLKTRKNHKLHRTDQEFKESDSGKRYVLIQNTMIIAGFVNLALSLAYFFLIAPFI